MTETVTAIVDRPKAEPAATSLVPPLREGDRLTQAEFHRRYAASEPGVRAQLINGVVNMASPVKLTHEQPSAILIYLLMHYSLRTPGTSASRSPTLILGGRSEPEPDALLRLLPEFGGRCRPTSDGYLRGPPELIVEVADATLARDLGPKRDDYQRAGVREYLVWSVPDGRWRSLDLDADEELPAEPDGVFRSRVFPGLWLSAAAIAAENSSAALATLELGLATPAHAEFVRSLTPQKP